MHDALPSVVPLAHLIRSSGLSFSGVGQLLAADEIRARTGSPYSREVIHRWCAGSLAIPTRVQTALPTILKNHTQVMDSLAEEYTQQPSIHSQFLAMRERLGMTQPELAAALTKHLPSGKPPSVSAISNWETEPGQGKSSLPSRRIFMGTDAITAYGGVFEDSRDPEKIDWFRAEVENIRRSFKVALRVKMWQPSAHDPNAMECMVR